MSSLAFRALAVWWARRSPPRLSSWHYSGRLIFLRALGVLGGQNVFGHRQSGTAATMFRGKIFRNLLEAFPAFSIVTNSAEFGLKGSKLLESQNF